MSEYAVKQKGGSIAVDDTLLVKGMKATAGSRMLEGFEPLFSAEAVQRLEGAGEVISGKTSVGEFGLDLVGEFSHTDRQEGALRGAAASVVAKGEVKAALGVDVNGAPRRSAALAGVCFLKPTYGTVSRYGVISTAASGETVGVYADGAKEIARVMGIVAGHDQKDGTSLPAEKYEYDCELPVAGKKICLVKNVLSKADEEMQKKIRAAVASLKEKGVEVEEVESELFDLAAPAWQILMCAETCNNISRYDGVKYGYRAKEYKNIDELYVNSRTEGFNFLTKAVILYGSESLSKSRYEALFQKALKVRRVVMDGAKKLLEKYDAILCPPLSTEALSSYPVEDAFERVYAESVFTALSSLTGLPAYVTNGVQLIGGHFDESCLLSLGYSLER